MAGWKAEFEKAKIFAGSIPIVEGRSFFEDWFEANKIRPVTVYREAAF